MTNESKNLFWLLVAFAAVGFGMYWAGLDAGREQGMRRDPAMGEVRP